MQKADMTPSVNIDEKTAAAVNLASKLFFEGKVFAYPTDTIYGFGANPFNAEAVEKINKMKRRDLPKNFIMLVHDIETLLGYCTMTRESHLDFLLAIWPNPISVILRLNESSRHILGSETSAFRIPNHQFCRKLAAKVKMPIISTSVNRSNLPPMNDFHQILQEFREEVSAVFFSEKPLPRYHSTIIDLTGSEPTLVREGKIKMDYILERYSETGVH